MSEARPEQTEARRFLVSREERRLARAARLRPRLGLRLVLFLLVLTLGVGLAGLVLSGRSLPLPVWAVAMIEDRLNRAIGDSHLPEGTALSLGSVEVQVERDLSPRILLRDLRLTETGGQSLLALPEIRLGLEPAPLLTGTVRPRDLRLTGARIAIARDASGRLALNIGGISGAPQMGTPAEVLDALDRMFSAGALQSLGLIEVQGLALSVSDARAGRVWELGDGRLVIENREDALAGELSVSQLGSNAQAGMRIETSKADSSAKISVTVGRVAAGDLAAQAVPLAFLSVIDAPISGSLHGELDADGRPGSFSGALTLEGGALDVSGTTRALTRPLQFDKAALALRYDPARQRVFLDEVTVESPSLRLKASGTADLMTADGAPVGQGELPRAVVTQLAIGEVMVDPEGLFEVPVRFSGGAASWRLWLDPFRVEIGEVVLTEGEEELRLSGHAAVAAGGGWSGAVDVALNRIGTERLIRLWPLAAVPRTRKWLSENVGQGELTDVAAALRFTAGEEPRFALDYEFSGAEVRVIRSLPPVENGHGRAAIQDNTYTVVIEGGEITAPEAGPDGARVRVDGSLFRVPDITKKPADAEVRLIVDGGLTATLSLLDQEPFRFITKAGREVDLGEGRALLLADLRFPLVPKVQPDQVAYDVTGRILGFRSDRLVPGKTIESPDLAVKVTRAGMTLSGAGSIEGVPVVARYEQPFGKDKGGAATLRGTVRLSEAGLRKLGVQLPAGWLSGETAGDVELRLAKGKPAELSLVSDLKGASLSVAPLGWKGSGGRLALDAVLGPQPDVTRLDLTASGLEARGSLSTRAGGGLDKANFSRLKVGDWLDATAEITGRGPGAAVGVRLTGGTLDLRRLPKSGGGQGGNAGAGGVFNVNLDRLTVTEGIALTGLSGEFRSRAGGLDGSFVAAVNGIGRVQGATVPYKGGTAVRITSADAGRVMAAAGIFDKGRGGTLDMTIQPRDTPGHYSGVARVDGFSIQNAPVLAELLSIASVVGLLEQLNGNGIQFNEGDVSFLIVPDGVQIVQGAAVGASMGISFSGFYHTASRGLDIQGTISPIYLLNGIGQIFTRKGEGLFGFNYRLSGPVKSPQISVNPLSILTPGMFRDIFRRPAPVLRGAG